jgi:hypothetical protein
MVELRDGEARPVPQLRRWLMFLLHQRRRQGRREAGSGTRVVGDGVRVRGPARSVRSGRRWMWRPTGGTERLRRFYSPPLRENER